MDRRSVADWLGRAVRPVRTALAAMRSKGQRDTSPSRGTGGQRTDRAVLSTTQGVITSDRIFEAALAPEWTSTTWPVSIAIGPERLLLAWIDDAPGERETYVGRPASIELSGISFLGVKGKLLGIEMRDGTRYTFALQDDAAARQADEVITQSIAAAGGRFTER